MPLNKNTKVLKISKNVESGNIEFRMKYDNKVYFKAYKKDGSDYLTDNLTLSFLSQPNAQGISTVDRTKTINLSISNNNMIVTTEDNGTILKKEKIHKNKLQDNLVSVFMIMKTIDEMDLIMRTSIRDRTQQKTEAFKASIMGFLKKFIEDKTQESNTDLSNLDKTILEKLIKSVYQFNIKMEKYSQLMTTISNKLFDKMGVGDSFSEVSIIISKLTGYNILNDDDIMTAFKTVTGLDDTDVRTKYSMKSKFSFGKIWSGIKEVCTLDNILKACKVVGLVLIGAGTVKHLFKNKDNINTAAVGGILTA